MTRETCARWTETAWEIYDDFSSPVLDQQLWEARSARGPDGERVPFADATAVETIRDGYREVLIERFTRSLSVGVQNLDNPKSLTVSTRVFEIPDDGWAAFGVDMSTTKINGNDSDYRDGFQTFNVIDIEHQMVVDAIHTGGRIHGLFELQEEPVGFANRDDAFLYVIDNPELAVPTGPGTWNQYEVVLDRAAGAISMFVDGARVFRTRDLPVLPQKIKLGMGILTLSPLVDGRSTSLRGQGMRSRWRNVRTRTGAGVAAGTGCRNA
jgi:hypothetical protein